ncbi:hypothetical protein HanIR_Chr05g0253121 [Helianthus annuus]|nr:hypothetical protein HanIR_Chr05g0253121 [Helianthus annuus]
MLQSKKEQVVVVERRGPDATWLLNVYHAHRWGRMLLIWLTRSTRRRRTRL